jgi:putative membrane protein
MRVTALLAPKVGKTSMRIFLAILAILFFGVPAHAQSLPERTGLNWLLGIAPSTEDFIRQVVLLEMFEMELNKAAESKGNEKTKAFASAMLAEHRRSSARLKALVRTGSVRVAYPTMLDGPRMSQLEKLQSLSGAEFDAEFEKLQIEVHEQAVTLFERYGSNGDHPDLKIFAYDHLPHLREHWRQIRSLSN